MEIKKYILPILLIGVFCSTSCETLQNKNSSLSYISSSVVVSSTQSSSITSSTTSSSVIEPSSSTSSSSDNISYISSSSNSISLPSSAKEFIDTVNSIVINENSLSYINHAFELFDDLEEWNYKEVLEAYDRLCTYEEEYFIYMFLAKVNAIPTNVTLEEEFLILRAEENYKNLEEELKSNDLVVQAYNKMISAREKYNILYEEALKIKDAEAASIFLEVMSLLPSIEEINYSHYLIIEDALNKYELLSDNAKTIDGVADAYAKLSEAHSLVNIQDGTDLFDINVVHKSNNWEAILKLKAKSDEHKVTGTQQVYEVKVYEGKEQISNAKILSWGDVPYKYSITNDKGEHTFAFSIYKGYDSGEIYEISFIVETDAKEAYLISYKYIVDGPFTCGGYNESELYKSLLTTRYNEFNRGDYSNENLAVLDELFIEGMLALENARTVEHAKVISNQYYLKMTSVQKKYRLLENLKAIEGSSVTNSIGNIVDNNNSSSWQASSTKDEYVIIDLGDNYLVDGLSIIWEVANAKDYDVKVSKVNSNWQSVNPVYQFVNGVSGNRTDELRFNSVEGRYIRLELKTGSTQWGFRIYELDVYSSSLATE